MQAPETKIVSYGNGVYAIDQMWVRAFLITGSEKALLIDTLAAPCDIKKYIKEITDLPVIVAMSHGDGDHTGNLGAFDMAYACEAEMSHILSNPGTQNTALLPISNGMEFDLGGKKLKAVFTPGHTYGSVSFLDEENKMLFSGDTVSLGPVYMFGENRNPKLYVETLNNLKKLGETGVFNKIYGCHNLCPVENNAIDELLLCMEGIQNKLIAGVAPQMPVPNGVMLYNYKTVGILY